MQNKKSVLLYCDIIYTVEKLDNETAGLLFKHYLRYINDLHPETNNPMVDIAFESIKQNLKRDLKKWEVRAENSRTNGSKGGRPTKPTKPSGLIKNPVGKKEPVTVNVTVTVIDNVIKEKRPLFEKWLTYRKEIKKPIKVESTLNALIKKFNSEPIEKIQVVVTTSIENGWTGLFWDKIKQQNNGQQISTAKALDKLING